MNALSIATLLTKDKLISASSEGDKIAHSNLIGGMAMSNVESAKAVLTLELEQLRQGAEYYAHRVATLELMLKHIEALFGTPAKIESPKRRGRKPSPTTTLPIRAKRGRPVKASVELAGKAKATGKSLPSTRGTFWKDQVTSAPKAWSEILDSAVANLGISPTTEQRRKLQSRMIFAINTLVKEGEIKDSGSGRERRFFV